MTARVDWAEQWGEWIIVVDDIGYRYFFDCKAEANEYLRLTNSGDYEGKVWRTLGVWCTQHKHNHECSPHWQRGNNASTN